MSHQAPLVDVSQLAQALAQFAKDRDWNQFHTPRNLVMALTGEVGELNEIFQWMPEQVARDAAKSSDTAIAVRDELADVLMYLVRLASVLEVDLNQAVTDKLVKNAEKYPAELVSGSSKKLIS